MGNAATKAHAMLQRGGDKNEDELVKLYSGSNWVELGLMLPDKSFGDQFGHNCGLHYAALHCMHKLAQVMLGKPDKYDVTANCRNWKLQTPVHVLFINVHGKNNKNEEHKLAFLQTLIMWRSKPTDEGKREKVNLNAADVDGNTPLFYAAAGGYLRCCRLLISNGAIIHTVNKAGETVSDYAASHNSKDASTLMQVFLMLGGTFEDGMPLSAPEKELLSLAGHVSYEPADLPKLIVKKKEMIQMIMATIQTDDDGARSLLKHFDWNHYRLISSFMSSPIAVSKIVNISPNGKPIAVSIPPGSYECRVCLESFEETEVRHIGCHHIFCSSCWEQYLTVEIANGNVNVTCLQSKCSLLVPPSVIKHFVSAEDYSKYENFEMSSYLNHNKDRIRWCPTPLCMTAVYRHLERLHSVHDVNIEGDVTCDRGHLFCFKCDGEAHAPCDCERWIQWRLRISELAKEETKEKNNDLEEELLSNLWMMDNTKACTKCGVSIQKNEGCNHMTCKSCKHEFCWVCLTDWKEHNQSTAGTNFYYACNRLQDEAAQRRASTASNAREAATQKAKEISRFYHYFRRFRNHENSRKLEANLHVAIASRIAEMTRVSGLSASSFNFISICLHELLTNRTVLRNSYAYGYFLPLGDIKTMFETEQENLEKWTERLSDLVGRQLITSTREEIIEITLLAATARRVLCESISRGFDPEKSFKLYSGDEARLGLGEDLKDRKGNTNDVDSCSDGVSESKSNKSMSRRDSKGGGIFMESKCSATGASSGRDYSRPTLSTLVSLRAPSRTLHELYDIVSQAALRPAPSREDAPLSRPEMMKMSWICPVCTLLNFGSASVCGACGHDLAVSSPPDAPGLLSVPLPKDRGNASWTCDVCSFENGVHSTRCTICSTAKSS